MSLRPILVNTADARPRWPRRTWQPRGNLPTLVERTWALGPVGLESDTSLTRFIVNNTEGKSLGPAFMQISLFLSRDHLQSALSLWICWYLKCWTSLPVSAGTVRQIGYLPPGERFLRTRLASLRARSSDPLAASFGEPRSFCYQCSEHFGGTGENCPVTCF